MQKRHTNLDNTRLRASRNNRRKDVSPMVSDDFGPFFNNLFSEYSYGNITPEDLNKYEDELRKASRRGCAGCLIWAIVILIIICLILYGLGWLGFQIISLIWSFLKSIFGLA